MTDTPAPAKGIVNPGSLFNSSEGLLSSALTTIVGGIFAGDESDMVKMVAIGGLSVAVAAYGVARAMVKRNA